MNAKTRWGFSCKVCYKFNNMTSIAGRMFLKIPHLSNFEIDYEV